MPPRIHVTIVPITSKTTFDIVCGLARPYPATYRCCPTAHGRDSSMKIQACSIPTLLWVILISSLMTVPVMAQVSTASIQGTVRDTTGGVIPAATVLLHNV